MEKQYDNSYANAPAYQQPVPQPMSDAAVGANFRNQRELHPALFSRTRH